MEKAFKRDFGSLDAIFGFLNRFISENQIDDGIIYAINLAVEELFTNMIKHNVGSGQEISITMAKKNKTLIVELIDFDVDPFDPDRVAEARVDAPVELREPGGLGLHLVKSVVDKVIYEYKDRRMTVTVVKQLEK